MLRKHRFVKLSFVIAAPLLWLTFQQANSTAEERHNTSSFNSEESNETLVKKAEGHVLLLAEQLEPLLDGEDGEPSAVDDLATLTEHTSQSVEQPDIVDEWALESTTATITPDNQESIDGGENLKPEINQEAYDALSEVVAGWELIAGVPIDYSLPIRDLFDDPENDLLSIKASTSLSGITTQLAGSLTIKGTPEPSEHSAQLTISAKDSYHGDEDNAWVTAAFSLPGLEAAMDLSHPLEGDILYRLESSQSFQNQHTIYEVVYCEAFKFINQEAFYAKATHKTHCPEEKHLNKIGSYVIDEDKLILSSDQSALHAEQTWEINRQYNSKVQPDLINYFVKVASGSGVESYTMQKSKSGMEQRVQQVTGEYVYQFDWHDYLLPHGENDYKIVRVGNYIFNRGADYSGPNDELFDSDLNIQAYDQSLSCNMLAHWYQFDTLAGQGEYDIEIISSHSTTNPNYRVECIEYPSNEETGQISIAFNSNYSTYDEFVQGEVYSYILRPKPQYADKVEELKLNLVYRHPKSN